ncbi:hypothetical protein [Sediminitomix flava]|uniref:Lipocalin-like protein n=1 Tax=Sediminitomix flava TaxID=379075 RepID=A0A315ZCR7_SEDFL|nr:hypothetical protein [Sediminitomix flava]PWJ42618.1 hypothetical protein BC781_102162 [Sediminitomix flava]
MKKVFKLIIALSALVAFSSCDKDDNDEVGPDPVVGLWVQTELEVSPAEEEAKVELRFNADGSVTANFDDERNGIAFGTWERAGEQVIADFKGIKEPRDVNESVELVFEFEGNSLIYTDLSAISPLDVISNKVYFTNKLPK